MAAKEAKVTGQPAKAKNPKASRVTKRKTKKRSSKPLQYEEGLLEIEPKVENQAISEMNATESPLLRLPIELRDRIYEYVLGGQKYKVHRPDKHYTCVPRRSIRVHFELLEVCRQIYYEAAHLPFALNTFDVLPHQVYSWTHSLLPFQRDNIGGVQVNWPEALYETYQLHEFTSLRRVMVCYVPDRPKRSALSRISRSLRAHTNNPKLQVTFFVSGH